MSRSFVISLVACLWLWLADSPRAEDTPPIIRHVFVPKDKSELWPEGDRVEVLFSEYEELRAATRTVTPQRRAAHIEWQSLSATFDSAGFGGGFLPS